MKPYPPTGPKGPMVPRGPIVPTVPSVVTTKPPPSPTRPVTSNVTAAPYYGSPAMSPGGRAPPSGIHEPSPFGRPMHTGSTFSSAPIERTYPSVNEDQTNELNRLRSILNTIASETGVDVNRLIRHHNNEKQALEKQYKNVLENYKEQFGNHYLDLKNKYDASLSQMSQQLQNCNSLVTENVQMRKDCQILSQQVQQKVNEIEQWKTAFNQSNANFEAYKDAYQKQQVIINEKEATIQQLQQHIYQLSQQQSSNQQVQQYYNLYVTENQKVQSKDAEILKKNQEISKKEEEIKQLEKKISEMNQQNSEEIIQYQQQIKELNELALDNSQSSNMKELTDELKETRRQLAQSEQKNEIYKKYGKDGDIQIIMKTVDYFNCNRIENSETFNFNDLVMQYYEIQNGYHIIVNVNNPNVYFVLIHDANQKRNNRYLDGKVVENGKVEFDISPGSYHVCGYAENSLQNITFYPIQFN